MIHTGVNIWGFGTHFVVQSTFQVPEYYAQNFDIKYYEKICNTRTRQNIYLNTVKKYLVLGYYRGYFLSDNVWAGHNLRCVSLHPGRSKKG